MRYNTDSDKFEFFQNGSWINISTGSGTGTVTAVSASEPPSTAINLEVTNPNTTPNVVLTYNGLNTEVVCGDGSLVPFPTTSIADGDKGDIVVSGSGSVWSVQNSTITNAKLLNPSFSTTIGTAGLQPNFGASYATLGAGFTLNIPLAATASVLAGTISKAQFDRFNSAAYDVGGILYTTNAEGASITSGILNMHHATATSAGVVTTTNQTWEGRKTLLKPLTLPQIAGSGGAPTLSDGDGAYYAEIAGTDIAGKISIVTDGSEAGGNEVIIIVNFATPYATAPYVVISPGNIAAAELTGTQSVFVAAPGTANGATTTSFKFISGDVPLANGEYTFTYHVIQ
jgi:hypothetical protein